MNIRRQFLLYIIYCEILTILETSPQRGSKFEIKQGVAFEFVMNPILLKKSLWLKTEFSLKPIEDLLEIHHHTASTLTETCRQLGINFSQGGNTAKSDGTRSSKFSQFKPTDSRYLRLDVTTNIEEAEAICKAAPGYELPDIRTCQDVQHLAKFMKANNLDTLTLNTKYDPHINQHVFVPNRKPVIKIIQDCQLSSMFYVKDWKRGRTKSATTTETRGAYS